MPGEGDKSSNCDKMTRLPEVINKNNHVPDKSINQKIISKLLFTAVYCLLISCCEGRGKIFVYILVPAAFYKRTKKTHQTTTNLLILKQFRAVDMILMLVHNLEI